MSQVISVTFVATGTFTWTDKDNDGVVASGTATSVQQAGQQALAAMKVYLGTQAANFTSLQGSWQ